MTKLWKIAGLLIGVVVIGLAGLYAYLTPDRLKAIIVPELESALNRTVSLDRVGLRLWDGLGASIAGLRVDAHTGFGPEPFIRAESGTISISLMSLIFGNPDIGEIQIRKPVIRIIIDEEGEANYSDLVDEIEQSSSGGQLPVLPITRLRILDGLLIQEDRQTGSTVQLEGIDYEVDLRPAISGLGFEGRLTIGSIRALDKNETGPSLNLLSIDHQVTLASGSDELRIDRITLSTGPIGVTISGSVALSQDAPRLDLKIEETTAALTYSESGTEVSGNVDIDIAVTGPYDPASIPPRLPSVKGRIIAGDFRIGAQGIRQPIQNGKLSITLNSERIVLEELSASIGSSDLSLAGTLESVNAFITDQTESRPLFRFNFKSDLLDLDQILSVEESEHAAAETWAWVSPLYAGESIPDMTSPVIALLQMLDLRGDASINKLVSGGVFNDLRARISSDRGNVAVTDISASVYGGLLKGSGSTDLTTARGPFPAQMKLTVSGGQAEVVLAKLFNLPLPIQGSMSLKMSGSGRLDSTLTLLTNSLEADGIGNITDGQITNWGWLKDAAGGIAQLSFVDFDRIPIQDLVAPFQIEGGRLITQNLSMTAADIPCRLNGSMGLVDRTLDYTLDMDLPADRITIGGFNVGKALGAFFGQSRKSKQVIPLQIMIQGTSARPKLAVAIR